ncbi:IS3 family transposase [Patescibacteria group bacterium]|nr:IS3 family transposase [Patescibacteria group bacterium]MBU1970409.1 IS3 family transposase [Patescibacteria group bacterium]
MLTSSGTPFTKVAIAGAAGISRSTLYYNSKLKPKDALLKEQILAILAINPAYGHRRLAIALRVNRKRVRRVMKAFGIKPYKRGARFRKRRDEQRPPAPYPNLIKGICPIRPGYIYVCDFTYIRYQQGFLYLATVMDLYTREIVGFELSTRHTYKLALNALLSVMESGYPLPYIIHSDQGSEYNCKQYLKTLSLLGIQVSMSAKASPWENGFQESFYHNFKTDLGLEFDRFDTLGELIEAVCQTITYYNTQRIHLSLKMAPSQFRQAYQHKLLLPCYKEVSEKRGT